MRRRTFLGATLAAISFALSSASLGLRAAAAEVASALMPRRRGIRLPPVPQWNKKTDDLDYADFARQVQDYNWSLLPRGTIAPREGQIWEAVRDCNVRVCGSTARLGPQLNKSKLPHGAIMTGYQPMPATALKLFMVPPVRLPKGEKIRVVAADPKPTSVTVEPLRYAELHDQMVPKEFRSAGYEGYRLVVDTARPKWLLQANMASLNEDFRLVEDVAV